MYLCSTGTPHPPHPPPTPTHHTPPSLSGRGRSKCTEKQENGGARSRRDERCKHEGVPVRAGHGESEGTQKDYEALRQPAIRWGHKLKIENCRGGGFWFGGCSHGAVLGRKSGGRAGIHQRFTVVLSGAGKHGLRGGRGRSHVCTLVGRQRKLRNPPRSVQARAGRWDTRS